MTRTARGTFEVEVTPQPAQDGIGDPAIGRLALDKRFDGDLQGDSRGQMLAVRTATEGSAGYVAIEVVTGTLEGRSGTFALQHSGTMTRGAASLRVSVIPDSGTGDLTGLDGTMAILIEGGVHRYEFDYRLPRA